MSLNSRLSSLISSDSSSHAHSQAQTRSSEQDGFADTLFKPGSIRQNTVSRAMEANIEEDLEARRPPYWHVSAYADLSPTTTDLSLEHAGWRHRRNQWGYCHALARYCKKRGSKEIPIFHQNIQACRIHMPQFFDKRGCGEVFTAGLALLCWDRSLVQ